MRKLATTKKISNIQPIEGADKIELATIDGWNVVVAKNVGHKVGDVVVYCEIDSFLPIEPEFEFLRKSSYRKLPNGMEGFRLRTIKLRGQISQGLIIPLEDAFKVMERRSQDYATKSEIQVIRGLTNLVDNPCNVTGLLGITKWEPPIPANLTGQVKGDFPSFIKKTDEERIQNLTKEYSDWKDIPFYVTEKLDGSSATYYLNDGEFGVCSRNLELIETDDNTFWKVARQTDIEGKLRKLGRNIAIQGELIGHGIQKNPYKINGNEVRFFTIFDIDKYQKVDYNEFCQIMTELDLSIVPLIDGDFRLPDNPNDLMDLANSHSRMPLVDEDCDMEGVVIRSLDGEISFKVISNEYLLKEI